MSDDLRKYIAELVGTFVLVFGGVGTAVLAGEAVSGEDSGRPYGRGAPSPPPPII